MKILTRICIVAGVLMASGAVAQSVVPPSTLQGNGDPANSHLPGSIAIGSGLTISGTYPNYTISAPAGSATVSTVSVVSANGLAGTVASPTTTPAITLSTTINSPALAGNGTAIIAATTTGTGSVVLGVAPTITLPNATGLPLTTGVTGILPQANGGNGTASPALTAGSNITITGTWPNYTINATGGGGSSAFSAITSGTNTSAAMVLETGSSIAVTGSATNQATSLTALTGMPNQNDQTLLANGTGSPAPPVASVLGCNLIATSTTIGATYPGGAIITGGTYAVSTSDMCGALKVFNGTTSVTISSPTTTGYTSGGSVDLMNAGTAALIVSGAGGYTFGGKATLSMPPGTGCTLRSDGATNYQATNCAAIFGTGSQILVNLKSFGAAGNWNGSNGTNDASALSAAIATINLDAADGIQACLYAPSSGYAYYINGAVAASAPTVPGCVIGDGQYLTTFHLGPSFSSASGYLFAQSEAWATATAANNFNYGTSFIGSRYQGFMITGNTTQSGQGGIDFLDRNDMVTVRDVTCQYITLSCISIGTFLADANGQAYMRESEFYNVKAWHSGSTTVPAIEIGSTTNGTASDATNELKWYGLNIFASAGPSLVLDTNYVAGASPKGTDDIMFYGTRIEQNANSSASDMIRIGGTTNTGSVYNVQFHGLEFIGMLSGSTGFHVAGTSVTGSGQGDNGIIADGVIYVNGAGVGVQLDQGKEISVTAQFPASLSTTMVVGSAVTCCVYVKQTGNATPAITNNASANILFQEGTFAVNGYAIDENGNVHAPTHIATPSTIGALPTCNAAAAGSTAAVSNGVASPSYLGTVSTTGAATDKVFCNGSIWVYD